MVFNLSPVPTRLTLPDPGTPRPLCGHGLRTGSLAGNVVDVPGDGALFAAPMPRCDTTGLRPVDPATTP